MTNFFDTLGIGSFAPTTSMFKLNRLVPDEKIPGTLNVGHALPTIAQAFIFIAIVEVEMTTLIGMIAASVAGAWLGAGVVATWPRRRVQVGMGLALLAAASFFAMTNLGLFPSGGDTLGLTSPLLWVGIVGNFVLGALMTLGIGLYAPVHDPRRPARHEPAGGVSDHDGLLRVPHADRQACASSPRAATTCRPRSGSRSAGFRPSSIAAFIVKSLPADVLLRWLVVAVVALRRGRDAALRAVRSARRRARRRPRRRASIPDGAPD